MTGGPKRGGKIVVTVPKKPAMPASVYSGLAFVERFSNRDGVVSVLPSMPQRFAPSSRVWWRSKPGNAEMIEV
jgi:hypothetical protein